MMRSLVFTVLLAFMLLLGDLFSVAQADVQNFVGMGQIVNASAHVQVEIKLLATMEAERSALEQAAAYLEKLPLIQKSKLKRDQLLPFTVSVVSLQTFDPQPIMVGQASGFSVKSKASIDPDLLPSDMAQYLHERYQSMHLSRHWQQYRQQMAKSMQNYVTKISSTTDLVLIGQLKQSEGKRLHNLAAAAESFQKGWHSFGLQRFDEAMAHFDQSIQLEPNYASFYFARGAAHFYRRQYDNAIQDFAQAVALNPRDSVFYFARGAAYLKQKVLFQNAANDMSKSIELDPNYADAYYARGAAYAFLKNCDRAELDFKKACQLGQSKACKAECQRPETDDY